MELNNKDFSAIDTAAREYFKDKKINQKCPRCGGEMSCVVSGNSYEVKCNKSGCISERFVGI